MTQINAVENPIINSPFDAPQFHWYIAEGQPPQKRVGRRPASYFFRVPERAARGRRGSVQPSLFEETEKGQEYLLDNANLLRTRVAEWRATRNFEGVTRTTRELLDLWHSTQRRERLFFAQLEAVETVIFLVEGPQDLLQGIKVPHDEPGAEAKDAGYRSFLRYALKMATGSGKTTVMGMLAAWSILNKVVNSQAAAYSDTVLIVCPNVTIRDRLQELKPERDELSIYRTRELVPSHRMPDLRRGDVIVTNWHTLERHEPNDVNGVSAKVVRRGVPIERTRRIKLHGKSATSADDVHRAVAMGAYKVLREIRDSGSEVVAVDVQELRYVESDRAFVERVLGARKGRSAAILVMNDEAHHAYRRGTDLDLISLEEETAEADAREATVWIEGLDRINRVLSGKANGIRLCIDLSATPFYIQGSGNEVGKPFPWVVSDFSLLEAIESGLVKIPQLPTQDVTGAETPAYFNIWRWVQECAKGDGHIGELDPRDVLRYASQPIVQLAEEWRKTAALWNREFLEGNRRSNVPPVFIVVCRDTGLAKEVHKWLAEGKQYGLGVPEFLNSDGRENTIRVDSKVAEELASGSGKDEVRRLRFVLETIGKRAWPGNRVPEEYAELVRKHNDKTIDGDGQGLMTIDPYIPPGRDVRCIISVAMLSEGWDATTVTHVVGLRPFGSQLLCEQVIGRALRRTSYATEERDGIQMFREETAKIFGVPFELIPFKVEGSVAQPPTPPAHHIYAVPAKVAYEIEFPVVEGYIDPGISRVSVNWDRVPTLVLDPLTVPDSTLVKGLATHDGALAAFGPGAAESVTLDGWRKRVRVQSVAFFLARSLTQRWIDDRGPAIPAHVLFPQMLVCAQRFLAERIRSVGNRIAQDVAHEPFFSRAVGSMLDAMEAQDEDGRSLEQAVVAGMRSTRTVDFHTGKPLSAVNRCHLNAAVFDTQFWEQSAAYILDTHPKVAKWVKNEHVGFVIPYRKNGVSRRYFPDFIVVLIDGVHLVVEIKGRAGDAELKAAAARRWCNAVNNCKDFGRWTYALLWHPGDLSVLLDTPVEPASQTVTEGLATDLFRIAKAGMEEKRREGWTKSRFAAELEALLTKKQVSDQ